ncbi:threonine-phosphate decarboxylase [Rhodovibrio sodomensis]|uniref:threonine-phosphate decarboxylase n=1 Tax=Rhodovibrio sodomensis TaxID=1088 RepID=A0ABS1DA00_9PROT|nr:threonine-phosphate decarboxylase CobD [Rhodovibrio sodomensis]MBK1667258.1 threonine-phosphate decarboxylase [Rhodovibrio sodomensis]
MEGGNGGHDGPRVAHGGNLADARASYGTPEAGWLDLSTGINPHPYPLPELPRDLWTALPQADAEAALIQAAADAYGAPSAATVVPAPGTQALIQLLPRVLGSDRAAVVGPTYGEYAPAWRAAGATVEAVGDLEAGLTALAGAARPALVVCNPNNPDGRTWSPDRLIDLAGTLAAHGGTVVVDEAFADVVPEVSVTHAADRPGLVVLRSFGKFFGLAGLRLGFALAPGTLARAIGDALGPWAVAGPAIALGRTALADRAWQTAMRARLASEAGALDDLLAGAGLTPAGGTSLYRLVEHADAAGWHDRLARLGIWVRAFPDRPSRLRVGLPGDERGWQRLAAALGPARTQNSA